MKTWQSPTVVALDKTLKLRRLVKLFRQGKPCGFHKRNRQWAGARKRNRSRAASSPLGQETVATVGTVATKRRVAASPAEGDCAGTEPSCQAAEGVHTRRRFFGIGTGKLANRGTPATCMAGSNSTSESGIAGDLLDAGISGREGQAPATRPSATMAASRSEYYGRVGYSASEKSDLVR